MRIFWPVLTTLKSCLKVNTFIFSKNGVRVRVGVRHLIWMLKVRVKHFVIALCQCVLTTIVRPTHVCLCVCMYAHELPWRRMYVL